MGAPCPKPLRSIEKPYGFPAEILSSTDRIKVEKGNRIADFCVQLGFHCMEKRIWFSIENPTNSILWEIPEYKRLLAKAEVHKVEFHACMWGGCRPKQTSFATNCPELDILRRKCNHNPHEHKPWGLTWHKRWKFAT